MDGGFKNIKMVVKKGIDLSTASAEVHWSGLFFLKLHNISLSHCAELSVSAE